MRFVIAMTFSAAVVPYLPTTAVAHPVIPAGAAGVEAREPTGSVRRPPRLKRMRWEQDRKRRHAAMVWDPHRV